MATRPLGVEVPPVSIALRRPGAWTVLARFLVEAILWRDYPIVQNLVMFIAIVVIVSNLVVDMLYGFLDPRVRYGH